MRKLSILFTLGLFLLGFTGLQAAEVNVTFQVDMNVQMLKGNFDPGTQVVRLAGSMQDWNPSLAPDMEDPDGDGIFEITYTMAGSSQQKYKFLIGTSWGADESQDRVIDIGDKDTTIAPVFFNDESAITFPASSDTTVILHLAVNMTRQIQVGNFDPDVDTVRAAGAFQGWDPAGAPNMEDPDGNATYVVTYEVKPNERYEYKFLIGSAWGKDELQGQSNRAVQMGVNDTALAPVYFDNDPYVAPVGGGDSINVTLQVDMSVKILEGVFDPSSDVVRAAGSYQEWDPASAPDMEDGDGDSVYVGTYKMPANSTQDYKFVIGTSWGNDEANNRRVELGANDTIIAVVYFDNDSVVTVRADGSINFNVRMDVMAEVLIFDPANDSLQVRGGFNGWGDSDPTRSKMSSKTTDPLEWFLNVPFVQQGVGDNQSYKYYVVKADESTTWVDGWERPASQGGGNRDVEFAGVENQDASEETTYYDDVHPDWVIESGKDVSVVFSVDMAPAMDGDLQAVPFNPATDTLYWIGEMPSFVNTQGWEDVDEMRVLKLTDDDGDNIFSATLSLVTPTFNTFEYRYAWRSQDGSWTFEPAGFGDFAYRIRYIGQDGARSFPTLPWNMPTDTWTNQEDKSDQQEFDPLKSLTSIGHTPDVPTVYELDQNYPNPFNPSTTIKFTVPVAGKVTLTVYNVVGQKIATLINGNVTAGSHTRVWNGKDSAGNQVASGVYFYKLTAEKFSATEKMILMK